LTGRLRDTDNCSIELPNPNAGALCEPATLWVASCTAGAHCCIVDDEPPTALPVVPLD
jgi:hypothetical protein